MKGSIVSKGIAIGAVMRIEPYKPVGLVKTDNIEVAAKELHESMILTSDEIKNLIIKTRENVGEKEAQIFEAHLMILEDPTLLPQLNDSIKADNISAASAVEKVLTSMEDMFKNLDSDYMKERALDIYDIKKRWVKNILHPGNYRAMESNSVILVAEELTPSDTLEIDLSTVKGLMMEKGGLTSHTAILAQSMDIPAIVGCGDLSYLNQDQEIIMDTIDSCLLTDFDISTRKSYEKKQEALSHEKESLRLFKDKVAITSLGQKVEIAANIAGLRDLEALHEYGAEGVGLFRTEFVYMNRSKAPTEDEQYQIYKDIVEGMDGKPIIFRTMDIGGDKEVAYMNMPKEENPFLGYRAIRYCLDDIDLFKEQLRAIYRVSSLGTVKIMFPMIGSVKQFIEAKKIAQTCIKELEEEGIKLSDVPLGIMIEIPSAAILAEQFSKHVDFFSIGTNDLTQYTLAVDRQNEIISDLYDYFDPSVMSLIHHVLEVSKKTNTWVGMCGSAAGDPLMIPVLTSWGIDELSMSATQVLKAKQTVCNMTNESYDIEKIKSCYDAKEVRAYIESI